MPTIFTAVFGPYDQLKRPAVVTPGWKYVCFTDQNFSSDVWEVRKTAFTQEDPQLSARLIKICFHRFIDDEYSIWLDGSFQVNCNLNEWWKTHFKPDITCVRHPIRDCIYQEAITCTQNGRKGVEGALEQVESYRAVVPEHSGLIQSGLLMRKRTDFTVNLCEAWFDELSRHSMRDQISFARVSLNKPINYIKWDYRRATEFRFHRHTTQSSSSTLRKR
jgi:hypothetical protein